MVTNIIIRRIHMSTVLKYSRQREAIRTFLCSRKDHPTAEVVYDNLRKDFPHISLGTVYRNLSLLVELGEAIKFPGLDGYDHFDGNPMPHYHFICNDCHAVIDLEFPNMEDLNTTAGKAFDGVITGHSAYFYGKCKNCNK